MKCWTVTIQMKATDQYFPVVLFIMLHMVILTESVDEILKCDHSNESYWAVRSCGAVYYAVQGYSNWVCGWNAKVWPFKSILYMVVENYEHFVKFAIWKSIARSSRRQIWITPYLFFLEAACVLLSTFPSPHAGILEKWGRKTLEWGLDQCQPECDQY